MTEGLGAETAQDASLIAKGQRNQMIDLIRGVLIVVMVLSHVGSELLEFGSWPTEVIYLGIILNEFGHFAAPVFFLMAGFMNAQTNSQRPKTVRYIRRRMRAILPQYIFICCFYIIYVAIRKQFTPFHVGTAYWKWFFNGIFVWGLDGHFYFVIVIIKYYIFFPLLSRLFLDPKHGRRNGWILLVVSAAYHVLTGVLAYKDVLFYPTIRASAIFWGFYFIAGMMMGYGFISKGPIHCLKKLGIPLCLAAGGLLYYATTLAINPFVLSEFAHSHTRPSIMAYNAVCTWFFALLFLDNPPISGKFFNWLGRNSLIIFLWHLLVIRALYEILPIDSRSPISAYLPLIPVVLFAASTIPALGYEVWLNIKSRARGIFGGLKSSVSAE